MICTKCDYLDSTIDANGICNTCCRTEMGEKLAAVIEKYTDGVIFVINKSVSNDRKSYNSIDVKLHNLFKKKLSAHMLYSFSTVKIYTTFLHNELFDRLSKCNSRPELLLELGLDELLKLGAN